jgi:hypothetical protein
MMTHPLLGASVAAAKELLFGLGFGTFAFCLFWAAGDNSSFAFRPELWAAGCAAISISALLGILAPRTPAAPGNVRQHVGFLRNARGFAPILFGAAIGLGLAFTIARQSEPALKFDPNTFALCVFGVGVATVLMAFWLMHRRETPGKLRRDAAHE